MTKRGLALVLCGLGLLLPRPALAQLPPGFGPPGYPAAPSGEPSPLGMAGTYPSAAVGGLSLFNKGDKGASVADKGAVPPPTLTEDGTPNAFATPCDCECDVGRFYVTFGAQNLRRLDLGTLFQQHLAGQTTVLTVLDPGVNIPGFPQFFDSGNLPPANSPVLLRTTDVTPTTYNWGGRATIGYQFNDSAIEITGFMQPTLSSNVQLVNTSRLDLPFAFSPLLPIGFEGDNNMWLQADIVRASFRSRLAGVEANWRLATHSGFEWILGVRYLNLSEAFSIYTDDDGLSTGIVDPTKIATYSTNTNNNLVCPQIGLEGEWPIVSWLAIGGWGKAALGPNFVSTRTLLQRGDGYIAPTGPNGHLVQVNFGQIVEAGLFADLLITDRIRIRAGYQALIIGNVALATDQIDPNLTQNNGTAFTHDALLYYGPMFELSLSF